MGDKTAISWCDHTWSPWLGCEPVSPGCAHCYASAISKRAGRGEYRRGMTRVLTKDWEKPVRWNRQEERSQDMKDMLGGGPKEASRVFPSMCDPFDEVVPNQWRADFFELIDQTPSLTWLLLTKRPELAKRFIGKERDNLWLGVSAENQEMADLRIPILLSIPARVRFVSVEPMLGLIDLEYATFSTSLTGLNWVIFGGESGPGFRPMNLDWLLPGVQQCKAAGVPTFVKQDCGRLPGQQGRIPDDLWKLKEFPRL